MKKLDAISGLVILLACTGAVPSLGIGPSSTAAKNVQEGVRQFSNGDFAAAGKAFTEADVAAPENLTIAFDRACVLAATGEVDKARELFQRAALARETGLAARAHYNLGCLAATLGRAALGDEPAQVAPEQRQPALSHLLAAVGHYRDCLRLDATHADARHNLELIRLFIKHVQTQWEQLDREESRQEMDLLEFLAMIEQRQSALRSTVRELADQSDSPRRRQATQRAVDSQKELLDELGPLKEKITAQFQVAAPQQPGTNAPNQPPEDNHQQEQAVRLLTKLADETGTLMSAAAQRIGATEFTTAAEKQREALDQLNQIFMAVAPFANILTRATQRQEQLSESTESLVSALKLDGKAEEPSQGVVSADAQRLKTDESTHKQQPVAEPTPEVDHAEFAQQQSSVTQWSRMLSLKAQAELPGIESQQHAMQPPTGGTDAHQPQPPKDDLAQPGSSEPNPAAQLEAMKQSLQKAIELGPLVEQHSESAAKHLDARELREALPDQQESLRLLREIAAPLAQQNQQQDNQQENQDGDKNQQQSPQPNQQAANDGAQKKPQSEQTSQEQSMAVLRRARERERQHRELQKRLQQAIGGRIPVDRDW